MNKICMIEFYSGGYDSDGYMLASSLLQHTDWSEVTNEEYELLKQYCNRKNQGYNNNQLYGIIKIEDVKTFPKKIQEVLKIIEKEKLEAEKIKIKEEKDKKEKEKRRLKKQLEKARELLKQHEQ